jgi:hypothetical protein
MKEFLNNFDCEIAVYINREGEFKIEYFATGPNGLRVKVVEELLGDLPNAFKELSKMGI